MQNMTIKSKIFGTYQVTPDKLKALAHEYTTRAVMCGKSGPENEQTLPGIAKDHEIVANALYLAAFIHEQAKAVRHG